MKTLLSIKCYKCEKSCRISKLIRLNPDILDSFLKKKEKTVKKMITKKLKTQYDEKLQELDDNYNIYYNTNIYSIEGMFFKRQFNQQFNDAKKEYEEEKIKLQEYYENLETKIKELNSQHSALEECNFLYNTIESYWSEFTPSIESIFETIHSYPWLINLKPPKTLISNLEEKEESLKNKTLELKLLKKTIKTYEKNYKKWNKEIKNLKNTLQKIEDELKE